TSIGAKNGVLFKGGDVLERAKDVDTVVFDKTGTLTEGAMELTDVVPFDGHHATDGGSETAADGGTQAVGGGAEPATETIDEETVLHAAASAESGSEHPLARAIVAGAEERGIDLADPEEFENVPGQGVRATVEREARSASDRSSGEQGDPRDGEEVLVGNRKLMREAGIDPAPATEELERLESEGKTAMVVARGDRLLGVVADADTVKERAKEAVAALHDRGVAVHMITGDNERTADAVAEAVDIDPENVRAGVLPED